MIFSSYLYLFIFLPISLLGYFLLNRYFADFFVRAWLLLVSLLFYCWWNPAYLPIIILSITINYYLSKLIIRKIFRKNNLYILFIAIIFNLCLLGYFKYSYFILDTFGINQQNDLTLVKVIIPLGISFFTLQQIAYQVDAYEGLAKEENFINYAVFVVFFPQLIAGPIVHHSEMMPQFNDRNKNFNHENFFKGIVILTIGLFQKVVIADTISEIANAGYDNLNNLSFLESWLSTSAFTLQLYFDFTGYCNMAIGSALMFNIKLPENFNSPYKSINIIEFWKKWHITLGRFINTYIYTPIITIFKKITFLKSLFTIFLVMLIAGIWHGAGWNFLVFGAIHGLALVINHVWKKFKISLPKFVSWLITLTVIHISFVFFRAENITDAVTMIQAMYNLNNFVLPIEVIDKTNFFELKNLKISSFPNLIVSKYSYLILFIAALSVLILSNAREFAAVTKPKILTFIIVLAMFVSSMSLLHRNIEFLYFQF